MFKDTIIMEVYLERYTKYQGKLKELGFKRKRPLPESLRNEKTDEMQKYQQEIPKGEHFTKIGETVQKLSQIFYLNNRNEPIIGKRCIGLFKVLDFPGDFDRFLHI